MCLAVFEAWAAMGATPMHSRAFGLAVRGHIKMGHFTPQVWAAVGCGLHCATMHRRDVRMGDLAWVCGAS